MSAIAIPSLKDCPQYGELIDVMMSRILTQYRESPNLIAFIENYLVVLEEVLIEACALPAYFNLDTAVGEQLTFIGRRMGFVRTHCVCTTRLVYGIETAYCEPQPFIQIAGLCDSAATFIDCDESGAGTVTINDDELYRNCLKVCAYRLGNQYSWQDLTDAIQILFGENAIIVTSGNGRVVIWPGRAISNEEFVLLQVYARILPVAMGIKIFFHLGTNRIAGIGTGWGGFCELISEGENVVDYLGNNVVDSSGNNVIAGQTISDADLLCEYDPRPYDCSIA